MSRPPAPSEVLQIPPEVASALRQTALTLAGLVGRWQDGLPALVRAELLRAYAPLIALLVELGVL